MEPSMHFRRDSMKCLSCKMLVKNLHQHISPFAPLPDQSFYFKKDILVLFLHNSYGILELPDCGNPEGTNWMELLRWANTEQSVNFRATNTDLSVHFRKANMDSSMHFRKANTKFLVPDLPSTLLIILLPTFNPTNLPICYTTTNVM